MTVGHCGGRADSVLGSKTRMIERVGNMSVETDSTVPRIRKRLEDHPHFRGRTHLLQIEAIGGSVVVSASPTYYLKQLLQEAIRAIPDVADIDNCVDVNYW